MWLKLFIVDFILMFYELNWWNGKYVFLSGIKRFINIY